MALDQVLDDVLGSRAKVAVLRCLWDEVHESLSGRAVARRTQLSHAGALNAIRELEAHRVVRMTQEGRFLIDREHELVSRGLSPLFALEAGFERRLTDLILGVVPRALTVVLFGSVARGEETESSDIDVLVIVPDDVIADDAYDAIRGSAGIGRFGRYLSPSIYTTSMLADGYREGWPVLAEIEHEGRVLHGEPVWTYRPLGVRYVVRHVSVEEHLERAREFLDAARAELAAMRWRTAISTAAHSGIASADAYLARRGNNRRRKDHKEALEDLTAIGEGRLSKEIAQLGRLLVDKAPAEYSTKRMTASKARDAVVRAERLLEWAERITGEKP